MTKTVTTKAGSGPFYLGIDVGGTNTKAGVVDHDANSLSQVSVPTEAEEGPQTGLNNIVRAGNMALEESGLTLDDILGIGLATPGTMDIPGGMLLDPPNLPGWDNLPIRQLVADRFQKQTVLQNDANAAAYGEFWAGAAKSASSLVFWTLGTGIGCGIIYHDVIIEGEHSHGSECGHMIIQMDGGRVHPSTGQVGTLEAYASARALIARCEEALAAGRKSSIRVRTEAGEELTPLLMAEEAEKGDALSDELIMDTARFMGVGTTSLMHTINPTMFLIGGAMTFGRNETVLGRRFLQRIKDEVRERAFPVPYEKTIIDYATLGGDAGYIGAAGCARLKFGASRQDFAKPIGT